MQDSIYELHGVRVLECAADGELVRTSQDAADLMSAAWNAGAALVAIPVSRLAEDFFRLKTGLAGEIFQRFVTYRMRLAVIGDVSKWAVEGSPFRDLVYECNHGSEIWFLADREALGERLGRDFIRLE